MPQTCSGPLSSSRASLWSCLQLGSRDTRGPACRDVCGEDAQCAALSDGAPHPFFPSGLTGLPDALLQCWQCRVSCKNTHTHTHVVRSHAVHHQRPPATCRQLQDLARLPRQGLHHVGGQKVCRRVFLSLFPDWTTVASGQGVPLPHFANSTEEPDVCGRADARAGPRSLLEINCHGARALHPHQPGSGRKHWVVRSKGLGESRR